FQAEDGIRDYKVTGVQTCALPIFPQRYRISWSRHRFGVRGHVLALKAAICRRTPKPLDRSNLSREEAGTWPGFQLRAMLETAPRSEERRVGKECRSRRRL